MYEITNKKTNKKEIIDADKICYGMSIITIKTKNNKSVLKRNKYEIKEVE